MISALFLAAVVGYFLGALPFGYWVARSKGINIFEHGSKNPGATNVRRVLGKGPGNLVFFLDALKGAAATIWPKALFWISAPSATVDLGPAGSHDVSAVLPMAIAGLIGALIGHSFSFFTGFKGGKGVATTAGGLVVLLPVVLLIALALWLATFYSTRYVSLASILAALSLPVSSYFTGEPHLLTGLCGLIAVFVAVRHRSNIERLMKGTESKFVKKT